jgi:hypothetical protein
MNELAKSNVLDTPIAADQTTCRRGADRAQVIAHVLAYSPEELARQNQALGLMVNKFHVEEMRAQLFAYFRRVV